MPKEIRLLSKRRKCQLIRQQLLQLKNLNNENLSKNVNFNVSNNALCYDNNMSVNEGLAIANSASQSQYQEINDDNVSFNETFLNLNYEYQKFLTEIKNNNKSRYLYENNQLPTISIGSKKLTDDL